MSRGETFKNSTGRPRHFASRGDERDDITSPSAILAEITHYSFDYFAGMM
jgi:hypothetical protein